MPPAPTLPADALPAVRRWETWLGQPPDEPLPPIRLILVWDNLAGHTSHDLVRWLRQRGVVPRYTPLSGSWLNMAESVQHILKERALAGAHPRSSAEIMPGWRRPWPAGTACPPPSSGAASAGSAGRGRRYRARWRQRCLRGSGATTLNGTPIAA